MRNFFGYLDSVLIYVYERICLLSRVPSGQVSANKFHFGKWFGTIKVTRDEIKWFRGENHIGYRKISKI